MSPSQSSSPQPDPIAGPPADGDDAAPAALTARAPHVPADRLVAEMVPPPRFQGARFDTYIPDPQQPSQAEAVQVLSDFADEHRRRAGRRGQAALVRQEAGRPDRARAGSIWTAATASARPICSPPCGTPPPPRPSSKAFGTFVELTNLVGALGFQQTVRTLGEHKLLCIDEFELDDPGDTVLVSTLLGKLVEAGRGARRHLQHAARTSSARAASPRPTSCARSRAWPPTSVRCASTVRTTATAVCPRRPPRTTTRPVTRAAYRTPGASLDDFPSLLDHLSTVHPSRYGATVRRRRGRLPHRRPPGARPVDGAAAGGARRPALRPRGAGDDLRRALRPAVRRRDAAAAATARSTSGRSPG